MTNIIDYVKWRSDLSFQNDSFNDIDALALSLLAYVEFNNVVISDRCSLKDVAEMFFKLNDVEKLMEEFSFTKNSIVLLEILAKSNRYQDILVSADFEKNEVRFKYICGILNYLDNLARAYSQK